MINLERTKIVCGFEVSELSPTSRESVVANCDECNGEVVYSFAYYNRKITKDGKIKCQRCGQQHRRGQATVKKHFLTELPLPPEVDIEATIKTYGYDPIDLKPWSRKKVVVRCFITNRICHTKRCALNRMQSVMETGHYISVGGWTKKRKAGIKASAETRAKMTASQIRRRQLEKRDKMFENGKV